MTRINSGINPNHLTDQHLLAEYREIVRIPNAVYKAFVKDNNFVISNQPLNYKLGTGHVIYFYDKIQHLHKRFNLLCSELKNRQYDITLQDDMFIKFRDDVRLRLRFYGNNVDDKYAASVVKDRIIERIQNTKRVTINKKNININEYINFLNKEYENK